MISLQNPNLITFSKTLFPNKVAFTGSGDQDMNLYFWASPSSPLHLGLQQFYNDVPRCSILCIYHVCGWLSSFIHGLIYFKSFRIFSVITSSNVASTPFSSLFLGLYLTYFRTSKYDSYEGCAGVSLHQLARVNC